MMQKVKILKCSDSGHWYRPEVGRIFIVHWNDRDGVWDCGGHGWINPLDCGPVHKYRCIKCGDSVEYAGLAAVRFRNDGPGIVVKCKCGHKRTTDSGTPLFKAVDNDFRVANRQRYDS